MSLRRRGVVGCLQVGPYAERFAVGGKNGQNDFTFHATHRVESAVERLDQSEYRLPRRLRSGPKPASEALNARKKVMA